MALNKELRVKELNTSGSSAVKSIDPYGRHNFFAEQMKEVNGSMDGEMFSKLKKPKYDEKQLLLAVDADVDELIPKAPKDLPDVVLRSEYNALLAELDKANAKIEELNGIISELRSKVSDLESQIAGLKSELDASLLRVKRVGQSTGMRSPLSSIPPISESGTYLSGLPSLSDNSII